MTTSPFIEKLLSTYFRYMVVAVVALFLAAGYFLVLQGKISTIQSITTGQKARAVQQLKDQKALAANLQASLDSYTKIFTTSQLDKLDAVLPTTSDFPTVLLTVKSIATDANLDLNNLSISIVPVGATPSAAAATPDANTPIAASALGNLTAELSSIPNLFVQDVSISVGGGTSYSNFKTFLSLLERSQRIFDVMTLSYAAPGDSETGATYSLTLRTYSYLAKATTTP